MSSDKPQGSADEIHASLDGALGDITTVMHNLVLVGIYMRGNKIVTPSGVELYVPDSSAKEDQFQGKVGLVLAIGPGAFINDARNDFNGQTLKVGDWIAFRVSDGWPLDINGVHCRLIEDIHVKLVVAPPTARNRLIW